MKLVLLAAGALLLLATVASAEEYWIHPARGDQESPSVLILHNPNPAAVTVEAKGYLGPLWTYTLAPGSTRFLDAGNAYGGTSGHYEAARTMHLNATQPIVVEVSHPGPGWGSLYNALPASVLGTDYVVTGGLDPDVDDDVLDHDERATEFFVIATEDNTRITITFSAATLGHPLEPSGTPGGATRTMLMNAFDTWHITSEHDLAATRVLADKPVAVIEGGNPTHGDAVVGDNAMEYIGPIGSGLEFPVCVAHDALGQTRDIVRIMAVSGPTTISVSGRGTFTLSGAGAFRELALEHDALISGDAPLQVMHYTSHDVKGDPESLMDPSNAWIEDPNTQAGTQFLYVPDDDAHVVMAAAKGAHDITVNRARVAPERMIGGYGCYEIATSGALRIESVEGIHAYGVSAVHYGAASTSTRTACTVLETRALPAPTASISGQHLKWSADASARPCRDHSWQISETAPGNIVATLDHAARAWTTPLPEECTSEFYWVRGTWPNGTTDWVGPLEVYNPGRIMAPTLTSDASNGLTLAWNAGTGSCESGTIAIEALADGWHEIHTTTDEEGAYTVETEPCQEATYRVTYTTNTSFVPGNTLTVTAPGCPESIVPEREDSDGDGAPDGTDNCEGLTNHGQADSDGNGMGDACDAEVDLKPQSLVAAPECELLLPRNASLKDALRWEYDEDCPITAFTIWTDGPVATVEHTGETSYEVPRPDANVAFIQVETGPALPELVQGRYVRVEATAIPQVGSTSDEAPRSEAHAPTAEAAASTKEPDAITGTFGLLLLLAVALLFVLKRRRD